MRSIKEVAPVTIYLQVLQGLGLSEADANNYMRCSRMVERTLRIALMKPTVVKEMFKKSTSEDVEIKVIKKLNNEDKPKKITLKYIKELKSSPRPSRAANSFAERIHSLTKVPLDSVLVQIEEMQLKNLTKGLESVLTKMKNELDLRSKTVRGDVIKIVSSEVMIV